MISFGISYYFIDVKKITIGIRPFVIYGQNAIAVYVLSGIVATLMYTISWTNSFGDNISIQGWMLKTLFLPWLMPINASFMYALLFVLFTYLSAYFLYKRKIFIKI